MNKTFRIVWSAARGAFIVTHEFARTHGTSRSQGQSIASSTALAAPMFILSMTAVAVCLAFVSTPTFAEPAANTLPTGGQIVAGAGSIATNGNAMTVNQATGRMIDNWDSFSIGSAASVHFQQPTGGVALNRVIGSAPSEIFGKLTATGSVYLTNPNGVLFGRTAQVDVGALVATTMKISDNDFMAGSLKFSEGNGSVVNLGKLSAEQAGYITLLAPEVRNEGVITASLGQVVLGAAEAVTLSHDASGLQYAVDKGPVQALVDNQGLVQADGGQVLLSARVANTLAASAINNSGTIEAKSLTAKGGKIMLEADTITLKTDTTLDASGATGGGQVLVGGGWQGSGGLHQATTVNLENGAKIDVSATKVGPGGTAVLWSDVHQTDGSTKVAGTITAEGAGGGVDGAGGQVETSGHHLSITDTASVKADGGQWLLDPYDFTIGTDITGAALGTALGSGDVSITTTNTDATCTGATCGAGSSSNGDIIFNDAVSWSANTLTLSAYRNIAVNNVLSVSGTAGLTLTTNTGNATGVDQGYLKMQQNSGSFGGKINWTSSGALTMNGGAYTKVTNQTELAAIVGSGKYFLANDLTLAGTWTPLTPSTAFSGVLDGLGHTLGNLTNGTSSAVNQGLFAQIADATLQNLGITSGTISGGNSVGAFVGNIKLYGSNTDKSYLRNLFTASAVTISPDGSAQRTGIGGIVGQAYATNAYIVDTNNAASINSPVGAANNITKVGGLVGVAFSNLAIKASTNSGTIIGGTVANKEVATSLGFYVGGIVGYWDNGSSQTNHSADTKYVANTGNIYGAQNVGGIAGRLVGRTITTIEYASNQGNITGEDGIGGLFGGISTSLGSGDILIKSSYNQGAVYGKRWGIVGGLAGFASVAGQTSISTEYAYNTGSVTNDNSSGSAYSELSSKVGGIFGSAYVVGSGNNLDGVRSTNTYSTGTITGGTTGRVGGFAGEMYFVLSDYTTRGNTNYQGSNTYVLTGSVSNDSIYGYVTPNTFPSGASIQDATFIKTLTNYTGSGFSLQAGVNNDYPIVTNFAPVTPLTFTFLRDTSKIYGQITPSLVAGTDYSLSSCSACLTLSFNSSTLGQWANAGDYLYSNSNLFTLGGSTSGYLISYAGTSYKMTVTPAALSVTGTSINNKTYTGTTAASFNSYGSLSGILNSDDVSINTGTTSATFASVNVANAIGVATSYALTGTKAGNYTVTNPTGLSANITQAPLTITALNRNNTYGSTLALGSVHFSATGLQNSESIAGVTLTANGGTAATDNAGSYTITPSAATGGTFSASNYSLTYATGTLTNDPAAINLRATAQSKTYGATLNLGTTAYTIGSGSLKNGDTITGLTLTSAGAVDTAAVGSYTITPSAATGTGGFNTTNYTISYSNHTLTVNKAPLTVTANSDSKTYDGNAYSGGNGVSYSGFVLGQDQTALGGALSYAGTAQGASNAGSYSITPQGYISGNYALNYVNGTLTIDKKTVSLSASKTYDGTTSLAGAVSIGTGIGTQTLTYNSAVSDSKDVADNATNYITGLVLTDGSNGGLAANYQLPTLNAANAPVTIAKRDVTVTGVEIADKNYDGTTNASSVQSTTLNNVAAADAGNASKLNTSGTLAAFSGKDVGTYSISVTGLALTGSEANNYNLSGGTTATDASVAITAKPLTLSASKTYDGTTDLTGILTLGGLIGSETLSVTSATASSSHVVTTNKYVSAITLADGTNGGVTSNYSLPAFSYHATDNNVTINAVTLTPTLTNIGVSKVYDGALTSSFTPTWSFGGLVGGDSSATLAYTGRNYNDKDVLDADTLTVSGLSITGIAGGNGSLASDYVLDATSKTVAGVITAKSLSVAGLAASNKVYDGTTAVTISNWGSVSTGVGSETLVLNHGTASFSDKNVATGKTVTATGYLQPGRWQQWRTRQQLPAQCHQCHDHRRYHRQGDYPGWQHGRDEDLRRADQHAARRQWVRQPRLGGKWRYGDDHRGAGVQFG